MLREFLLTVTGFMLLTLSSEQRQASDLAPELLNPFVENRLEFLGEF